MNKERLKKYCDAKQIFYPPKATKEYLEAAIVRAASHKVEVRDKKTCFGYWEQENSTCMVCDFKKRCFKVSLGMDKGEYFKALENAESPRLRFLEKRMRK